MSNQKKQDLMNELNEKSREISKLNFQIQQIETEEQLPEIKKLYENTYYKTPNGYGDASKSLLYIYIGEVTGVHEAKSYRFEEKQDVIEIDPRPLALFFEDGKLNTKWDKITKKEFDEAFNNLVKNIQSLNK